jgi:hypothetical protein
VYCKNSIDSEEIQYLHDGNKYVRADNKNDITCNCTYHVGCFKKAMFNWIENGEDPNKCICPMCKLKDMKEHVDRINKKIRKIKQITQEGTIGSNNALKCVFHDSRFTERLDQNPKLIGFRCQCPNSPDCGCEGNGVYDLSVCNALGKRTGAFRSSLPDDAVTKTVGYAFVPFNWGFYNKVFKGSMKSDRLRFACGHSNQLISGKRCKNCSSTKKKNHTTLPNLIPEASSGPQMGYMEFEKAIEDKSDYEDLSDSSEDEMDDITTTTAAENALEPDPENPAKCEHLRVYYSMELLEDLFMKIFPNSQVREYARIFHASLLCGDCPDEKIHFYTGMNSTQTGSNGKSTIDT